MGKNCPHTGKVRHDTQGSAEQHAMELIARMKIRRVGAMGAYPCRRCGGWHVGHRPKGMKKRQQLSDIERSDLTRRTGKCAN